MVMQGPRGDKGPGDDPGEQSTDPPPRKRLGHEPHHQPDQKAQHQHDADTIRPLGEPREGEQTFASYVCGSSKRVDDSRAPSRVETKSEQTPAKTETYPIR